MVEIRVSKGEHLLLSYEAYMEVLEGSLSAFNAPLNDISLPPSKSIPISAEEDSLFRLVKGSISRLDRDPIPQEWKEFAMQAINNGWERLAFVGGVDTGKTGLATYLMNVLLDTYEEVYILDADVGQSDVGLPTSIALGISKEKTPLLTTVDVIKEYSIGLTSPRGLIHRVIEYTALLVNELDDGKPVLLNTTGWVSGPGLYKLKRSKLMVFKPDKVVVLGDPKLADYLGRWFDTILVPAAETYGRDPGIRTSFRSWKYREYFCGAKCVTVVDKDDILYIGIEKEYLEANLEGELPLTGLLGAFTEIDGSVDVYGVILGDLGDSVEILSPRKPKVGMFEASGVVLSILDFSEVGWNEKLVEVATRDSD